MQLFYNVIKNTCVVEQGNKEIITDFKIKGEEIPCAEAEDDSITAEVEKINVDIAATQENMIAEARKKCEELLDKANEDVEKIKSEAYDIAYSNGETQGYKDAYERTIQTARQEAEEIINNANAILFNAKQEYEEYVEKKKGEIIGLSINMAETILKKELGECGSLNEIVFDVLSNSRNTQTFIIRTDSNYVEELKSKLQYWKESLGLKGEIFVIADEKVGLGNAIIEKNNGKVEVGIAAGMEGIRQALL